MLDSPYPRVIPDPPRPSQILYPASLALHSGRERFDVEGGSAVLIRLGAGDRITLTNAEGGQRCEMVAADATGRIDAGLLGVTGNSDAAGLKALLSGGLAGLRQGIARRGIDLERAGGVALFDSRTAAGTAETFTASRDGVVIVAAPGTAMDPGQHDTLSPIVVSLQRAVLRRLGQFALPDPLADPVLELRVKSSTAGAYVVKAGDYIQIIDHNTHADGACLPDAGPAREILRSRRPATGRSRAGYCRAA
jgi:aminomethyltransferase